MTDDSTPHSGPYLAAEGETWVTMAHYEELLAERDRIEEQYEAQKTNTFEVAMERRAAWDEVGVLKEQLDALRVRVQSLVDEAERGEGYIWWADLEAALSNPASRQDG